jgi:hypothetical protein
LVQPHAGLSHRAEPVDHQPHLRAFGLKPHRTESIHLSSDPLLVEKVRDIVGLYLEPPHHALVLCVDEKSQIQESNTCLAFYDNCSGLRSTALRKSCQEYRPSRVSSE